MPHISRSHRYSSAFVNVRVRTEDDYGTECPICMRTWCVDDACNRTMTQTGCCFQFLCASCVTKISQRCLCEDGCKNVVFICSFCRNISRTETVALFVGSKRPCKRCRDNDAHVNSPEEHVEEQDTVDDTADEN